MIREIDRKIVMRLVEWKIWSAERGLFRTVQIIPRKGTRWVYELMLKRQTPDNRKHAPCCPANHWHNRRLVFQGCNCRRKEK